MKTNEVIGGRMYQRILGILFLLVFSIFPLSAEERIAGTLDNVDLFASDLHNDEAHNFGERYRVYNRNSYPVRISIKLAEGKNVENQLINYTIIVKPHSRAELGFIHQNEISKPANWKYEWQASRDH